MPNETEKEFARDLLINIQRTLKGPGKKHRLFHYYHHDQKTGKIIDTYKMAVGGDRCWAPAYMYFDSNDSALIIYTTITNRPIELVRIDLNNPRSLIRAHLRKQLKKARERYSEECQRVVERLR